MRTVVTNHAIDRLKQRFGLKFYRYTSNRTMMRNLIIGQVETGRWLTDWKHSPFYVNKMASMYGPGIEIYLKSGVYFVCQESNGVRLVKTCVERVLYYKKVA